MRSRTKARARALQVLYAWEIRGDEVSLRELEREVAWPLGHKAEPEVRGHAIRILDLIRSGQPEIDARIEALAANWRLSRMTSIDRNILRIAVAEMLGFDEIPLRVSLHEAIRLAEWFGTGESSRFINGVLDALLRELEPEQLPDAR